MKKQTNLGFTLIELMIVVAIIGVLAVLAIFGVSKYLKNAKTAEATNSLGAINQDAVQAYNKETTPSGVGVGVAAGASNNLCVSSTGSIPAAVPNNQKFTVPPTGAGSYGADPGFSCLGFQMNQPQYFAYDYTLGGGSAVAGGAIGLMTTAPVGWATGAAANFDGTNTVQFATGGNIVNNTPITATSI
ncbi:MAG: type II secretion system protein, partial [Polyangiaceae bacterium]